MRLAEEYDAAQDRGEVAGHGRPKTVSDGNSIATAADLGLSRKDIHEARQMRDAERESPGLIQRSVTKRDPETCRSPPMIAGAIFCPDEGNAGCRG